MPMAWRPVGTRIRTINSIRAPGPGSRAPLKATACSGPGSISSSPIEKPGLTASTRVSGSGRPAAGRRRRHHAGGSLAIPGLDSRSERREEQSSWTASGKAIATPKGSDVVRKDATGELITAHIHELGDPALTAAYDRFRIEGHGRRVIEARDSAVHHGRDGAAHRRPRLVRACGRAGGRAGRLRRQQQPRCAADVGRRHRDRRRCSPCCSCVRDCVRTEPCGSCSTASAPSTGRARPSPRLPPTPIFSIPRGMSRRGR